MKYALVAGVAVLALSGCAGGGVGRDSSAGVALEAFSPTATVRVGSVEELQKAVNGAAAGERIVLAAGSYTTSGVVTINCAGTAERPIVIDAETIGGVEIKGKAGFTFGKAAAWVVVEGFKFTHSSVTMNLPEGTKHLRVTRNEFALVNDAAKGTEASTIEVSGDDCEVDHNYFHDKHTEGCWVTVQGPGRSGIGQRTWIHHNEFNNFMPTENNCSAIQVGLSWRSMSSGFTLVEYNLFIKCRGENEGMVCNKSCDNVYRYNTITDGTRELSLRHGNRCMVYGNYFLNTDGIRFFGHDHRIFSNYFEGCSPAIHVGNGDATIPPGKLQMHDEPMGAQVAFNTLVDNKINFYMGAREKPFGATGVTIANNIVVGGGKAAEIDGPLEKSVWEGNIVWNTKGGVGNMPVGGFVMEDPVLKKEADGIWRVQAGSPAIGAAVGEYPYVKVDLYGRARGEKKDVGAEQVSDGAGVNRVLTERDVGPGAK